MTPAPFAPSLEGSNAGLIESHTSPVSGWTIAREHWSTIESSIAYGEGWLGTAKDSFWDGVVALSRPSSPDPLSGAERGNPAPTGVVTNLHLALAPIPVSERGTEATVAASGSASPPFQGRGWGRGQPRPCDNTSLGLHC